MNRKQLGIFKRGNEWICGRDVNNGACCSTYEIAEALLAATNKYYHANVKFSIHKDENLVEGRISGVCIEEDSMKIMFFIRYNNEIYRRYIEECIL